MKFTIKLGKPKRLIVDLLKQGHNLEGPLSDWDGIPGSELYYGQSYESEPKWKEFLEVGANQVLPDMVNQGASAVLFVPILGDRYLIYVFGYGFLSVNSGFTEWDFGLKVVLNSISPVGIKSMDSHTINEKAKNKRIQVATQAGVNEFDVDIMQDLVSQISGRVIDQTFAKSLTGGESLTMIVDMEGSSIAKKSREIVRRYGLNTYQADFKWIDFIAPIKDTSIIDVLNQEVNDKMNGLIQGVSTHEFVLSYPTIIEIENIDFICFKGFGSTTEFDFISIADFVKEYQNCGQNYLAHNLESVFIDLYDGHGKVFKSFSLHKCLTTEIEYSGHVYILTSGTWFKLDEDHYQAVTDFFTALTGKSTEYVTGVQTKEKNEVDYLSQPQAPGHELFDRRLYRKKGVVNAIEYADIVNDAKEIIHVKDGSSSTRLSHLFNQGFVSGRLLLTDKKFRTEFRGEIANPNIKKLFPLGGINPGNTTIVFRILKKGPNFTIPFFSKIMLYDTYIKITGMGYRFRLEWVEYK